MPRLAAAAAARARRPRAARPHARRSRNVRRPARRRAPPCSIARDPPRRRHPALLARLRRGRGGARPRYPAWYREESPASRHAAPRRPRSRPRSFPGSLMDCDTLLTDLLLGREPADAEAHLSTCPRCTADAPVVRSLRATFDALPDTRPPSLHAILSAAGPLLAANAKRLPAAAWRRLAAAIGVAVLPLPLILLVVWHALHALNDLLSSILPESLRLYLLATQALAVALLLAVTYGAVPLLAAHQLRLQLEESHA